MNILTNPNNVTLTKKVTLRKRPLPMSLFTSYSLKIKFVPFLKIWPATIPCKKDDKVDKKVLVTKKGKEKKESEREAR